MFMIHPRFHMHEDLQRGVIRLEAQLSSLSLMKFAKLHCISNQIAMNYIFYVFLLDARAFPRVGKCAANEKAGTLLHETSFSSPALDKESFARANSLQRKGHVIGVDLSFTQTVKRCFLQEFFETCERNLCTTFASKIHKSTLHEIRSISE